jgi:ABC-type lipoprotein export system ATPase subunit
MEQEQEATIPHECLAEVIEATRSYENGRVMALRGVNLRIEDGEFVAIIGSSGSGKTTLLQLLGGLDTPTSGEVKFREKALSEMGDLSTFRAEKVGFVFQSFHLLPTLTACENVQLPMVESPLSMRDREERAIFLLKEVGLADRTHHRPTELSGGERQRVAIARSLANKPDLLLADEPTGNLDCKSTAMVMELLARLHRENGMALVLVTHDLSTAAHAGRCIEMSDGVVVKERTNPAAR